MLISEAQLNDKKFFEEIKIKSQDFIDYDQFREAYDLAKLLEQSIDQAKGFKDRNYELYRLYKEIIIKMKWVGLPIMSENMAIDYFQNNLTKIFNISWYNLENLWRKLTTILLSIMVFGERDKFKKNLIQALLNNQEKITGKKIIVNNQEKQPTVANWMQDYISVLGTGKINKLARTQYLINGKNTKDLNEQEKNRIKLLFDIYEKLKLSSLTIEGVEEEIPVDEDEIKGIIIGGVFETFKEEKVLYHEAAKKAEPRIKTEAENNLAELRRMAANYPPGSFERKAIEEEIDRVARNS
ncbi:hypothetical protein HY797_01915 [Candidatus Falkowbacteria bacterium]|nr:hypothetical protein [Candidatus Falkowbacteria bacterium]